VKCSIEDGSGRLLDKLNTIICIFTTQSKAPEPMDKYLAFIAILIMVSCHQPQKKKTTHQNSTKKVTFSKQQKTNLKNTIKLEEYFCDSLTIGKKKLNKVELFRYSQADSNYVVIKFYSKVKEQWQLRNEYSFEKDGLTGCDAELSDFNGDGLQDFTYRSNIAGRGANAVRRLLIYDKNTDNLISMKNAEQYPNMQYNSKLKCIDAFSVYAGCTTTFLKISADSLREFASVTLYEGLTVRVYDKNGKEKILLRDTTNNEELIRYKNFNPLEEY
jgi:hypothetical protein